MNIYNVNPYICIGSNTHSPDSIDKSKLWHLVTYWFRLHMKRGQYTWQKAVQELWQLLVNFMDPTHILVFFQWPTKIVMSRQFRCNLEIFLLWCDDVKWRGQSLTLEDWCLANLLIPTWPQYRISSIHDKNEEEKNCKICHNIPHILCFGLFGITEG